jgi:feruloyl esterase
MARRLANETLQARSKTFIAAAAVLVAAGVYAGSLGAQTAAQSASSPAAPALPGCSLEAIRALAPAGTTINAVERLATPVRHCRIDGYVTTTNPGPNKNNFRIQLPDKELWTNRFFFIGLGGSGGYVPTDSEVPGGNPLVMGFAVAGTDKGHTTDQLDWSFGNDPAKALDNAHRGAHVTTVAAQAITRAYYGASKMYRYETGCSGGGDMGMKAMQFYPNDYDGVLLGWPGGPHPQPMKDSTIRAFNVMVREMTREPGAWLSPTKRDFLDREVMNVCDIADGAKDEMIWDPRLCKFDFSKLKCTAADGPTCLTQPEITSVTNILRETASPISNIGSWMYLGTTPPPWSPSPARENVMKSAAAYVILNGWARTALKQPDRDIVRDPLTEAELKIVENSRLAAHQWPGGNLDLAGFERAGGKAIFYVGIGDPAFPHESIENWFARYTDKVGPQQRDNTARLYQVPGWGHCGGGSGPNDGTDVMLQALIDWVENGKPPLGLEMHRGERAQRMFAPDATKTIGVAVGGAAGTSRDFLVCPYPLVSVFDAKKAKIPGAVYHAANWSCQPRRN